MWYQKRKIIMIRNRYVVIERKIIMKRNCYKKKKGIAMALVTLKKD